MFIDSVFLPDNSVAGGTIPFGAFVYSVWGAAIVIWGIKFFFICRFAFKKREPWAWWALLISTCARFSIAFGFSLRYGALLNAIGDATYLLLIVVPLAMTRDALLRPEKNR